MEKTVLQNVLLPETSGSDTTELYARFFGDATVFDGKILLSGGAEVSFDTYFGVFSIEKWKKYTEINDFSLTVYAKGKYDLTVSKRYFLPDGQQGNVTLFTKSCEDETTVSLPNETQGVLYFSLRAHGFVTFERATFNGALPNRKEIKLCGVICTYRREEYVKRNVSAIKDLAENETSPLRGKLDLIVVDNGKTLEGLESDSVTLIRNKNVGGAGGFTRGLIAFNERKEKFGYTHVLLMDDDVSFEKEAIFRTVTLLSALKDDYKDAFIGGSMFRLDRKFIQNELADRWDFQKGKVAPVCPMLDMRKAENVAESEKERPIDYFSWWYCVMPADVPADDNLPLPIFIKRDDIEYGLRNGKTFLTLSGINVWHEPFEDKRPAFLEYYYTRNRLIMETVLGKNFTKKEYKNQLKKEVVKDILAFRYNEAAAAISGMEDFVKGADFLKNTDPTALNKRLMGYNAKLTPMEKTLNEAQYNAKRRFSKVKKLLALFTMNGWLLPRGKTVVVPTVRPDYKALFGAKRAINVNKNGDGFVTEKSYKKALETWKYYKKTAKTFDKKFEWAKNDYRAKKNDLISLPFWKEYLNREEEPTENTVSDCLAYVREREEKSVERKTRLRLVADKGVRNALRLFSILKPIKNNRVVFVTVKRRGYCENLKYVAEKLKEKYGDKYDMYWMTEYPETCEEVKERGIKVVKNATVSYMLAHLTAKVVIYNDAVPSYVFKRKKQIYINLWHGAINYKHIGPKYLEKQGKYSMKKFLIRNPQPDYYLSGSEFFTENTADSFSFDKSIFLPWGLARNDILFEREKHEEIDEKVRAYFGIGKEKKIALYAPTFRNGYASDMHGLDVKKTLDALKDRFGGDFVMLYRGHAFVLGENKDGKDLLDATKYHDMQELLVSSSVLISDYSSAMWDMSFLGRPIFVFAPDMDEYVKSERSFAYPLEKWRYPIAKTNDELKEKIETFNENEFQNSMRKHHKEAGSYENENSSAKIAELVDGICFPKGKGE